MAIVRATLLLFYNLTLANRIKPYDIMLIFLSVSCGIL